MVTLSCSNGVENFEHQVLSTLQALGCIPIRPWLLNIPISCSRNQTFFRGRTTKRIAQRFHEKTKEKLRKLREILNSHEDAISISKTCLFSSIFSANKQKQNMTKIHKIINFFNWQNCTLIEEIIVQKIKKLGFP